MVKKVLALILALVITFSLSACGEDSVKKLITDTQSTQSSVSDQSTAQVENSSAKNVSIENTVLLNQDGIIVTAKDLVDDSILGTGIEVLVENNTDKNLSVRCNSLIVNNYMITNIFSCSVAAGKKANDTIYLSSSELKAAGITTISDIILSFHVSSSDTFDTLFDTDEIELKTSAYSTTEQPAMDDGKELYNQGGIRIVGKYVDENSFWGAGILLFIENKSDGNVIVQCDDLSINGFMVTPYFSCTVNKGRMALSNITIMSDDLKKNNITSVDNIELVFKILNPDTYEKIAQTNTISFSAK